MINKILLAEDNKMNCKLLLHGLKQYQVDVARDGREAIELFKNKPIRYSSDGYSNAGN